MFSARFSEFGGVQMQVIDQLTEILILTFAKKLHPRQFWYKYPKTADLRDWENVEFNKQLLMDT